MKRAENKVVIVTGGALGIGRETCILLAKEKAKVAVTDILDREGEELVAEIKKSGGAGDIPHYHASKGAVRLMAKNDALIYAKDKIRVNSVHPGFIWTPLVEEFGKDVPDFRENLNKLHPIGHVGEPMDIAYGILYLVSDESKFVTGSELVIDGGYTCK